MVDPETPSQPHDQQHGEADCRGTGLDYLGHGPDVGSARPGRKRRMRVPLAEIIEASVLASSASEKLVQCSPMRLRIAQEARAGARRSIHRHVDDAEAARRKLLGEQHAAALSIASYAQHFANSSDDVR